MICPDAAGIDNHVGANVQSVSQTGAAHLAGGWLLADGDDRCVVGGDRAVLGHSRSDDREGEAGIVGSRIPVDETRDQPVGFQGGKPGQGFLLANTLVAPPDAPSTGQVVQPEGICIGPRQPLLEDAVPAEQRDEKRQRFDQMRSVFQ